MGTEENRKTYNIIDCRARPDTKEFIEALKTPQLLNDFRKLGQKPPEHSKSLQECMCDFENWGISRIICMGRDLGNSSKAADNEYVATISEEMPEKITGIAGINPFAPDAIERVDHTINKLHLKGISMEPAFMNAWADDERIFPLYEYCQENRIPVFMTIGPRPFGHGTEMKYCSPMPIDTVAARFPELRILVSHGGFPWIQEMIAIAFRNDNVWFETSAYWFMPGVSQLIVEAANGYLRKKICFGSAYPFAPVKQTLQRFRELPFDPDVLPFLFEHNIKTFLGEEK